MPVDLHVRESGGGAPLVLLHAFPLSSAMWLEQRNDLGEVARVVTPDLRGFGGSQLGDDEPSLDHMADDVAALLDGLSLDTVVLGGLSMGGYVAMAFLRRHPGRVDGLLLADTKAGPDPDQVAQKRLAIANALDEEQSTRVLVDEVLPGLVGETTRTQQPLVLGRVRALVEAAPPAAAAWAERAMVTRPDSLDTLSGVDVPALVLRGAEDAMSTPDDCAAMVEALPRARFVEIAAAGHLSAVETPAAFSAAVRGLLDEVAG